MQGIKTEGVVLRTCQCAVCKRNNQFLTTFYEMLLQTYNDIQCCNSDGMDTLEFNSVVLDTLLHLMVHHLLVASNSPLAMQINAMFAQNALREYCNGFNRPNL